MESPFTMPLQKLEQNKTFKIILPQVFHYGNEMLTNIENWYQWIDLIRKENQNR